jgi:hypothetical protein
VRFPLSRRYSSTASGDKSISSRLRNSLNSPSSSASHLPSGPTASKSLAPAPPHATSVPPRAHDSPSPLRSRCHSNIAPLRREPLVHKHLKFGSRSTMGVDSPLAVSMTPNLLLDRPHHRLVRPWTRLSISARKTLPQLRCAPAMIPRESQPIALRAGRRKQFSCIIFISAFTSDRQGRH